jgi:uncharacterized protein (TIGR03067 family)
MYTLLLGVAVLVAAPAKKDPPKKEPPSIVGEWIGLTGTRGGKPDPPVNATMKFTADGTVTLAERGKGIDAKFKADPKKDPPEIDIEMEAGGMKHVIQGIYKIEGDTLTVCFLHMGGRPKVFESPVGSEAMLITLKRGKKD